MKILFNLSLILGLGLLMGCDETSLSSSTCYDQTVTSFQPSLPVLLSPDSGFVLDTSRAISAWNKAVGVEVFKLLPSDKGGKHVGYSTTEDWTDREKQGWQAYTRLVYSGFAIVDFDIHISPHPPAPYDSFSMLVHELGHTLGLSHYPTGAMQPYLGDWEKDRGPDEHSTKMVQCLYNLKP